MMLREALADWTDSDRAAFLRGLQLGIFEERDWLEAKWVFWIDNPLGVGLHDALLTLVRAGVLESRDDDYLFRWREGFDWREADKPGPG